ncbi:MAG: C10 family peptidase [Melioribacteraceae bacterium]|nr:C10 family peptidase [Melioribacteraceae bacterium]
MKKTFILIFLLVTLRIFSYPVSLNDATNVADFYLELNCDSLTIDDVVEFKNSKEITIAYIANLSPSGFIAVSTDTDIRPIIAYSFNSNFSFNNDINNNLYHILAIDLSARLQALNDGQLPDILNNNGLWDNYINENWNYFNQRDPEQWPEDDSGWLETTWHQGDPYNAFCPLDPETMPPYMPPIERCVVGCGPLALAQVLNYYEHIGNRVWNSINDDYISTRTNPNILIDENSGNYDFPSFPELNSYLDDLRNHYTSGNVTNQDIAALSFISGIALEANYSSSGTGASPTAPVIIEKFEYDYAERIWNNLPSIVYPEFIMDMKNAQPVLYYIRNSITNTGHVVVCDGYRINEEDEDFFHLNFGWGDNTPVPIIEAWYDLPSIYGSYVPGSFSIAHICPPGYNGLVSGNIQLNGGSGDITDVVVTVGYKTTNPDANGNYEIEIFNGNYAVSAYLWGYEEAFHVEEVEVVSGQTSDVDLELSVNTPSYIYVPTHYDTIHEAITEAVDGDFVVVLPGTYNENINFQGKRIKVVSFYYFSNDETYIENTIINGDPMASGYLVTINQGEDFNSLLEGFTLQGSTQIPYKGLRCTSSSPTLKNLRINGTTCGNDNGAALYLEHSDSIIENLKIQQIYDSNTSVFLLNSNPILNNILIHDNDGTALSSNRSNPAINNITIYNNDQFGIHSIRGSLDLNNSLIWGNEEQIHNINGYTNLSIDYSDIQGGSPVAGVGNIISEPLLNDDFQPNWTETEYSPLIDAGDPSILDPDGTPSDIGAVRARGHKIDSIELIEMTEGINWKCLPVIDTVFADYDIASHIFNEIQQIPFPALEEIVFQDGVNIYYDVNEWQNNTRLFTSDLGCKIHMNDPYTLQITGFLEDPYHVIELELGDNWIGFYLEGSMKPLDAFEAVLDDIDMIQTKTFTLNKTALGWLGAANWTINYGDLVVVHCTNNCSLYWGEDGGGTTEKSSRSSSQDFEYTEEADYLPVYVELDNQALGNPTEIGLIINGECKGAEVITDSLVQLRAYVLNDTTVFDPGDMELQLSYGSRSLNTTITDFKVKHDILDEWESNEKYITQGLQNYYLISLTDTENNTPVVNRTTLSQNYPNPFNPTTTINYSIAEEGTVELTVYNIKGQKVVTLVNEIKEAGQHSIVWNGKDNNNKTVSSGIYFYRLSTGKRNMKKKMLLLK